MGQGAWGGVTTKTLGSISYNTPTWEEDTGGIYEVEVDDSLVSEVETTPVGVVSTSSRKMSQTVLIAERADGIYYKSDLFNYRINPGEEHTVDFFLTEFGKRKKGAKISIGFDNSTTENTGEKMGGTLRNSNVCSLYQWNGW